MLSTRDIKRLAGVHPLLVEKVGRVLASMEALGLPMFVVQGVRTVAQQKALYAKGRTKPGAIVTMKDGVVHKSNHQPRVDGFGHAVDCAFDQDDPFDVSAKTWEAYGKTAESMGLVWGGRWSHPHDAPHIEL